MHSTGTSTRARTASRSANEPENRRSSVSTLITRAPPDSYSPASQAGSGIALSAPARRAGPLHLGDDAHAGRTGSDAIASFAAGRRAAAALTWANGTAASRAATSARTPTRISSRTLTLVPSSAALPAPYRPPGAPRPGPVTDWPTGRCPRGKRTVKQAPPSGARPASACRRAGWSARAPAPGRRPCRPGVRRGSARTAPSARRRPAGRRRAGPGRRRGPATTAVPAV